jgi:hypothetical protein
MNLATVAMRRMSSGRRSLNSHEHSWQQEKSSLPFNTVSNYTELKQTIMYINSSVTPLKKDH